MPPAAGATAYGVVSSRTHAALVAGGMHCKFTAAWAAQTQATLTLVERFDIEPFADFSAK